MPQLQQEQIVKTKRPSMYSVILYNDDFTPFEFVESILSRIFKKESKDVMAITQVAHNTGKALVGVYVRDVAVTRVQIAMSIAKDNGFPLKLQAKEND